MSVYNPLKNKAACQLGADGVIITLTPHPFSRCRVAELGAYPTAPGRAAAFADKVEKRWLVQTRLDSSDMFDDVQQAHAAVTLVLLPRAPRLRLR